MTNRVFRGNILTLAMMVLFIAGFFAACGSSSENGSPPSAPTHGWAWLSGSKTASQSGTYGIKGVAAPANVPGARVRAVSWRDSSGKLWLFGGVGFDSAGSWSQLNDLWRYDPTSNQWAWVSGSDTVNQAGIYGKLGLAAPANVPGARDSAVSWIDGAGKLWLFGGTGFVGPTSYGELGDLWRYDPASNEWTWVSGSNVLFQAGIYGIKGEPGLNNTPGARAGAVSWLDSGGKLWLFGGEGYDSAGLSTGALNDLWRFDPASFEWTWVSGSDTADQSGVYGTKGMADPLNVPGARYWAASCRDANAKLWLFGGWAYDSAGYSSYINDLWMFDPANLQWSWVSGSDIAEQSGSYGSKGMAAATNAPGARYSPGCWIDSGHNIWLFGGVGFYAPGYDGLLNDLWKFDPTAMNWTWVSGSDTSEQGGIYGTKGTASASNVPGARSGAVAWIDPDGNLWLFGGNGLDSGGQTGLLNDLWRYSR